MPGVMPMSVAVSELVTEARGLLMRLTTTVGYRSPSAEHEASEPPCEKLAWETWVMLVVPRDTPCSSLAAWLPPWKCLLCQARVCRGKEKALIPMC